MIGMAYLYIAGSTVMELVQKGYRSISTCLRWVNRHSPMFTAFQDRIEITSMGTYHDKIDDRRGR